MYEDTSSTLGFREKSHIEGIERSIATSIVASRVLTGFREKSHIEGIERHLYMATHPRQPYKPGFREKSHIEGIERRKKG